jgi:hypothetical protein
MAEALCVFRGTVRCARAAPPLTLTLSGATAVAAQEPSSIAFSGATVPADLPATLNDAEVTRLADGRYRIASAAREWLLTASAAHLTRDVGAEFYRALPPRPVPLGKRLLWRTVLALAGSRIGPALLRALRR